MADRKVLYQLETADGIRSEIREGSGFVREIKTPISPKVGDFFKTEQTLYSDEIKIAEHRTYEVVGYETVTFIKLKEKQ